MQGSVQQHLLWACLGFLVVLLASSASGSPTSGDHYQTLGVSEQASFNEIKAKFRVLALQLHPDKNPDPGAKSKFEAINEAYQVLSDEDSRRKYDLSRSKSLYIDLDHRSFLDLHNTDVPWIILIYSSAYRSMATFDEAALKLKGIVNCGRLNTEGNYFVVQSLNVRYVPMIYSFYQGTYRTYHGQMTVDGIISFASSVFPSEISPLSSATDLAHWISNDPQTQQARFGDKVTVIYLHEPAHVPLKFKVLAKDLASSANFFGIPSSSNAASRLTNLWGVKVVPTVTIVDYSRGEPIVIPGDLTLAELESRIDSEALQYPLWAKVTSENYPALCPASTFCVLQLNSSLPSLGKKALSDIRAQANYALDEWNNEHIRLQFGFVEAYSHDSEQFSKACSKGGKWIVVQGGEYSCLGVEVDTADFAGLLPQLAKLATGGLKFKKFEVMIGFEPSFWRRWLSFGRLTSIVATLASLAVGWRLFSRIAASIPNQNNAANGPQKKPNPAPKKKPTAPADHDKGKKAPPPDKPASAASAEPKDEADPESGEALRVEQLTSLADLDDLRHSLLCLVLLNTKQRKQHTPLLNKLREKFKNEPIEWRWMDTSVELRFQRYWEEHMSLITHQISKDPLIALSNWRKGRVAPFEVEKGRHPSVSTVSAWLNGLLVGEIRFWPLPFGMWPQLYKDDPVGAQNANWRCPCCHLDDSSSDDGEVVQSEGSDEEQSTEAQSEEESGEDAGSESSSDSENEEKLKKKKRQYGYESSEDEAEDDEDNIVRGNRSTSSDEYFS